MVKPPLRTTPTLTSSLKICEGHYRLMLDLLVTLIGIDTVSRSNQNPSALISGSKLSPIRLTEIILFLPFYTIAIPTLCYYFLFDHFRLITLEQFLDPVLLYCLGQTLCIWTPVYFGNYPVRVCAAGLCVRFGRVGLCAYMYIMGSR